MDIKIKLTATGKKVYGIEGLLIPQSSGSVGLDLRACETVGLERSHTTIIPVGIMIAIPKGMGGFIYSRSGLGSKGIVVAQGVGVIDQDYRGEIKVALYMRYGTLHTIEEGDRIAQMVIQPVKVPKFTLVDELDETERGDGGFGHTGNR